MTWRALAALDALLLAYCASRFGWADFDTPRVGDTPAGWIIQLALVAIVVLVKSIAAAFVAAVAYAIYREVRGPWRAPRLAAALLTPLFIVVLALLAWLAYSAAASSLTPAATAFVDRFVMFDRLAAAQRPGESIGAYLVAIALAVYLAEKYLLRWWNLRWPISIAALAILSWPAWTVMRGEEEQRDWRARQEWRVVQANLPWLDAMAACAALGDGWRLPRRTELALYASAADDAAPATRGTAWTLTAAEYGRSAVVVDLAPKRGGTWRSNSQPWRDRSPCENNATQAPGAADPRDWFASLRTPLCESNARSPSLYTSGLKLLAEMRGTIVGGPKPQLITRPAQAAAICIRPARPEARIPIRGRGYPHETEFTDPAAFVAAIEQWCPPQANVGDAVSCAAFLPITPNAATPAAGGNPPR